MNSQEAFDKGSDMTLEYVINALKTIANEDTPVEYTNEQLASIAKYAQTLHEYVRTLGEKNSAQGQKAKSVLLEANKCVGVDRDIFEVVIED